jgi:hypothetical protein
MTVILRGGSVRQRRCVGAPTTAHEEICGSPMQLVLAYWLKITFRLVTKPLIFNHQNNARGVETNVDIVELWAGFQSEKTGSTPVGSAMKSLSF